MIFTTRPMGGRGARAVFGRTAPEPFPPAACREPDGGPRPGRRGGGRRGPAGGSGRPRGPAGPAVRHRKWETGEPFNS